MKIKTCETSRIEQRVQSGYENRTQKEMLHG